MVPPCSLAGYCQDVHAPDENEYDFRFARFSQGNERPFYLAARAIGLSGVGNRVLFPSSSTFPDSQKGIEAVREVLLVSIRLGLRVLQFQDVFRGLHSTFRQLLPGDQCRAAQIETGDGPAQHANAATKTLTTDKQN